MKLILATGIYPPEIGGIATYAQRLATELKTLGHDVRVIAYGEQNSDEVVTFVSRKGNPWQRWKRYAKTLKQIGVEADIIYALSTVSVGVPVWMAKLQKPKKILRLGGDFLWERFTDQGGMLSLEEYYQQETISRRCCFWLIQKVLNQFDALVFSTDFQRKMYAKHYRLPKDIVIENALLPEVSPTKHTAHDPFRLLVFSRFVGFKNLGALIQSLSALSNCVLTLVGDGPYKQKLKMLAQPLQSRVSFRDPVSGTEKKTLFDTHDLLVVPSLTDISPNAALEARSSGLPVLLTEATGLQGSLTKGMSVRQLRTPSDIASGIRAVMTDYAALAQEAALPVAPRDWKTVANDHIQYFSTL